MTTRSVALLIVPFLATLAGCNKKDETPAEAQAEERAEAEHPDSDDKIEKIAEEPATQYGQEVTLEGSIDEVLSDRAFRLEEHNALWGDKVLVLLKEAPTQPLKEDTDARITGKVSKLVVAEVEKEIGWDLDEKIEVEYEEKPVVIAESLAQISPGT